MRLVPSSKIDFEACSNLATATDDEIAPIVSVLLEWLQDFNWPVAPLVQERLATLGAELIDPAKSVLRGNDNVWKYWLVSSLLPLVRDDVFSAVAVEVERIASNPTEGEKHEEVHIAAQELLKRKHV